MTTRSISTQYFALLFFTIILCFIAYGFTLTNFTLSIDSEQHFYSDTSLPLGRWGTNLFRYHIFGGIIPYFTLLLGLISFSLAAVEIAKLFHLPTIQSYVFCGILVTFPQMAYQFVFTMQADAVGFGFLVAALSVRCFMAALSERAVNSKSSAYFIAAALLYMFAIGVYQALALIPIVIYLIIMFQSVNSEEFHLKVEVRKALMFGSFIILSGIFYLISLKIFAPNPIQGGYLSSYTSGTYDNLISNFTNVWGTHLNGNAYYGNKTFLIASIAGVILLIYCMIMKERWLIKSALIVSIFLVPFLIAFFITGGYYPPRLYVASGIVMAFFVAYGISLIPSAKVQVFLPFAIIMTNIYFITMLFWSLNKCYRHDINIATDIKTTIKEKCPEFDPKTQYVYFFGCVPYEEHEAFRLPESEIFGGSFFQWDNGSNSRIIDFMKFTDVARYKMIDQKEIYLNIKDSISPMPVWPKEGYVKQVGNVVIVKLGNKKGTPLWVEL